MKLTNEFVNLCKIDSFDWIKQDLPDFCFYSDTVSQFYLNTMKFSEVIDIFDSLDDDSGYLSSNMLCQQNYNKIFDVMYKFYQKIRELYFKKFIEQYENDIDNNNPLEIIEKYVDHFKPIIESKKYHKVVNANAHLYRARLGKLSESGSIDGLCLNFDFPYYSGEMKNPPSSLANEGRFNRDGYSYYYLSSSREGAISEVRPSVGSQCSVATFEINEDLIMFEFGFLLELYNYFMQPVYEGKRHYRYSQFFADIVYRCGFDGIQYNGAQNGLLCIVCFYPKKIKYLEMSEVLYKIKSARYSRDICEPEFIKYDNWHRLDATNYSLDQKREEKINHMIEHEKDGKYKTDEQDNFAEAWNSLNKLDDNE